MADFKTQTVNIQDMTPAGTQADVITNEMQSPIARLNPNGYYAKVIAAIQMAIAQNEYAKLMQILQLVIARDQKLLQELLEEYKALQARISVRNDLEIVKKMPQEFESKIAQLISQLSVAKKIIAAAVAALKTGLNNVTQNIQQTTNAQAALKQQMAQTQQDLQQLQQQHATVVSQQVKLPYSPEFAQLYLQNNSGVAAKNPRMIEVVNHMQPQQSDESMAYMGGSSDVPTAPAFEDGEVYAVVDGKVYYTEAYTNRYISYDEQVETILSGYNAEAELERWEVEQSINNRMVQTKGLYQEQEAAFDANAKTIERAQLAQILINRWIQALEGTINNMSNVYILMKNSPYTLDFDNMERVAEVIAAINSIDSANMKPDSSSQDSESMVNNDVLYKLNMLRLTPSNFPKARTQEEVEETLKQEGYTPEQIKEITKRNVMGG